MNRIGNKWTKEEEKELIEGIQSNRSMEELSIRHQRTVKALEMRIEIMVRRSVQTMSTAQIASHFHLSETRVKQILENTDNNPSQENLGVKIKNMLERLERIEHLQEKIYKKLKSMK